MHHSVLQWCFKVHLLPAGQLTLVADLGHFTLESDVALASSLTAEKASLYECLKLDGKDLSAYLVDGEFSFAALQQLGRPADQAEGLDTAIQPAGKVGHGGTSIFVPLLDRCGLQAALQAARFPHPSFPQIQTQLQVASLNFFFSPARIARVLRVVKAALPGKPSLQPAGASGPSAYWCLSANFSERFSTSLGCTWRASARDLMLSSALILEPRHRFLGNVARTNTSTTAGCCWRDCQGDVLIMRPS